MKNAMRLAMMVVAVAIGCGDVSTAMLDVDAGDGGAAGTGGGAGAGTTGAGGAGGGCADGAEGCACYGNGTCDGTLQCQAHICVVGDEICPAPGCADGQTCMNGYCYGLGTCSASDGPHCEVITDAATSVACGGKKCTIGGDGAGVLPDGSPCKCRFNHSGLVVDCRSGTVCY